MQHNSKIIGALVVGGLLIAGLAYLLVTTPASVSTDTMLRATSSDDVIVTEVPATSTITTDDANTAATTTPIEAVDTSAQTPTKPVPTPTAPTKPVVTTPTPAPVVTTPAPVEVPAGITMSAVASHNSAASCWSVIDGKVYDLTTYIPKHPGGKGEILAICGRNGSSLFAGQHGGESKPERILAGYYIDVLSQ